MFTVSPFTRIKISTNPGPPTTPKIILKSEEEMGTGRLLTKRDLECLIHQEMWNLLKSKVCDVTMEAKVWIENGIKAGMLSIWIVGVKKNSASRGGPGVRVLMSLMMGLGLEWRTRREQVQQDCICSLGVGVGSTWGLRGMGRLGIGSTNSKQDYG